jgi:surfeit locus 1 family protein
MSGRVRSLAAPAAATLIGLAVLVGLGVWQLKRLAWKEALIAAVEARALAPPVEIPSTGEWAKLNPRDYEYRHVRVSGVYDYARQAMVFRALADPRGRYGGPGYLVMTPLELAGGDSVLVNRGFVPEERKAEASAGKAGPVEVTGLMRSSEDRSWFTPADDPAHGQWFTRDVEQIAKALKLGPHAPFSIDADASADADALPEGGETILAFPNNHLSYAITWFGMALALAGVFTAYAVTQLRSEKNPKLAAAGGGEARRHSQALPTARD